MGGGSIGFVDPKTGDALVANGERLCNARTGAVAENACFVFGGICTTDVDVIASSWPATVIVPAPSRM